jgi:protein SCO1/2
MSTSAPQFSLRSLFQRFVPAAAPAPVSLASAPAHPGPKVSAESFASPMVVTQKSGARLSNRFPDAELRNHRGETRRFRSDLVSGQKVLIGFIYTRCEGVCPRTLENMKQIYTQLQAEMGHGTRMLCLTVDVRRDTVADLKAYAETHGLADKPGWEFLVGSEEDTLALRRALGAYELDPEIDRDFRQHSGLFIMGNDRTNRWMGLASGNPSEIVLRTFARVTREGPLLKSKRHA